MASFLFCGAAALDMILSVPYFPAEDTKLRATKLESRGGGNALNSLTCISELARVAERRRRPSGSLQSNSNVLSFVGALGDETDSTTQAIVTHLSSAGISHDLCPHRSSKPSITSYIVYSESKQSRTIVTLSETPEMTATELEHAFESFVTGLLDSSSIFVHVEGRNVSESTSLVKAVSAFRERNQVCLSAEFEKPDRVQLEDWLPELDIVFMSSTWVDARVKRADVEPEERSKTYIQSLLHEGRCRQGAFLITTRGSSGAFWALAGHGSGVHTTPPRNSDSVDVVDTNGAGDVFLGAVTYGLSLILTSSHNHQSHSSLKCGRFGETQHEDIARVMQFAVDVATLKCSQRGIMGLSDNKFNECSSLVDFIVERVNAK
ncbi:Ribokinase-like protein [Gonapodya prolifera JEL478]|uniref:Ribokinase-like protein n=1 Tax=Gonapodya prolifera (strain JEL478) TaxID=1344416 RepID=A0A139AWN0_GONPJ|nr:Ribokinase-like protein [Gonapodya prolifera JEL478]|eukprot:KXS21152.1 Ribokinase-like protein [Gonapodya prolifera JEL478]